jgi:hypothetical protein
LFAACAGNCAATASAREALLNQSIPFRTSAVSMACIVLQGKEDDDAAATLGMRLASTLDDGVGASQDVLFCSFQVLLRSLQVTHSTAKA